LFEVAHWFLAETQLASPDDAHTSVGNKEGVCNGMWGYWSSSAVELWHSSTNLHFDLTTNQSSWNLSQLTVKNWFLLHKTRKEKRKNTPYFHYEVKIDGLTVSCEVAWNWSLEFIKNTTSLFCTGSPSRAEI